MILIGVIFILIAVLLQYFYEKSNVSSPIRNLNINFWIKLCRIFGVICVVIGFILIFLSIVFIFTAPFATLATI